MILIYVNNKSSSFHSTGIGCHNPIFDHFILIIIIIILFTEKDKKKMMIMMKKKVKWNKWRMN